MSKDEELIEWVIKLQITKLKEEAIRSRAVALEYDKKQLSGLAHQQRVIAKAKEMMAEVLSKKKF